MHVKWHTYTPEHATRNLYAVRFTVGQLYHPAAPWASPLLWREALGHRLQGGSDRGVCGQFILPPGESCHAARAHTGHAMGPLQCTEPSGPWAWPSGWNSRALVSIKLKWIWLTVWTDANWFSKHWVTISVLVLPTDGRTQLQTRFRVAGQATCLLPWWAGLQAAGFQELRGPAAGHAQVLIGRLPRLFVQAAHHSLLDTCVQITLSGRAGVCGRWSVDKAAGGRALWWVGLPPHVRDSTLKARTAQLILSSIARSGRKYM